MRPEGVAAAQRELKRLTRAYRQLATTNDIDEAEDAWVDFLTLSNKIYLKLRAACHGQGVDWMWWKKKMDERRDDPLLAYIHHARNSDTHRLEQIAVRVVGEAEEWLRLAPAVDAGIVYQVPKMHNGAGMEEISMGTAALLAGSYLELLVAEAASRLR